MSFLEGLFAAALGKAIVDYREENKKAKQWNDLYEKLLELQDDMSAFLERMNFQTPLVVLDPDVIDAGEAGLLQEKMRLNRIKEKIIEFVSLGGNVENIADYEEIDFYLEQMKKLIRLGIPEEQDDCLGLCTPMFDFSVMIPYYFKQYDDVVERVNAVIRYLAEQEDIINTKLATTAGKEYKEWQQTKEYLIKLQAAIERTRNTTYENDEEQDEGDSLET
ncbi:MAG: hypothetical protein IKE65_08295 [Clostridia bacterium]|nr:hypothetical protein [Clostridia bacterium]